MKSLEFIYGFQLMDWAHNHSNSHCTYFIYGILLSFPIFINCDPRAKKTLGVQISHA